MGLVMRAQMHALVVQAGMAVWLLTACVSTRVITIYDDVQRKPTTSVEILKELPTRQHVKIALLESTSRVNVDHTRLVEALVMKAQELGADAILCSVNTPLFVPYVHDMPGALVLPTNYVSPRGVYFPVVRGVIFKYQDLKR